MAAVKSDRNTSIPDSCECPSEIPPQKMIEDSMKQITTDKSPSLEIKNNLVFEDPSKKFSYNIHEKQDESEAKTGWHTVLDVIAKDDNKSNKNPDMEKCRETDFAITNWEKVDDIPLKFDEMPPEPDWATVSHVVVEDAKNSVLPDKAYVYEEKGLPQRHVNRRSSCPDNRYSSYAIHEKQNNLVLDAMVEYDNKNHENSDNEESTETVLTTTDWKKLDSIPLKFDELPPEPGWATVSNVVVKNKKNHSRSDKKDDNGEKGPQQRHASRRSSCPDNHYFRETLREKLSQMKVSKDEVREGSLNRSHKLEDLDQKNHSYTDNIDTKYMQHDQYHNYHRSLKPFPSSHMSSDLYRPRDPSPDYD